MFLAGRCPPSPLDCLSFDVWLMITSLFCWPMYCLSFDIYGFWLLLWYLQTFQIMKSKWFLYDTMTSTDILWSRRRYNVPRVQLTVANYTLDDFKSHFRLTRMTFKSTYLRLGPLPEYNNAHGQIPYNMQGLSSSCSGFSSDGLTGIQTKYQIIPINTGQ
jgi:hypothetical protein